MTSIKVTGGANLKAFIQKAKAARSVDGVEVGFFSSARYPDGTPVTNVAAKNEFGVEPGEGEAPRPARPFFTQALADMEETLLPVLKESLDSRTLAVDHRVASRLGLAAKARIQRQIRDLKEPALAERTVRAKGSSNPLIDTNFMRAAVTYKVK